MLAFTTKAETLQALAGKLSAAEVLPQVRLTAGELRADPARVPALLRAAGLGGPLIVRSSARNEDTAECSNAGKFLSIPNVEGEKAVLEAAEQVAAAMGPEPDNQIFIQPFLAHVELCHTPLAGIDLSSCNIEGITVSDTCAELRGATIDALQASVVASLMGVILAG